MKHIGYFLILLVLISISNSQQLKPCVADNGGGISQDREIILLSSIGQSICGTRNDSTTLETGFVTLETTVSEINEEQVKPEKLSFGNFFPNPFNSKTQLDFALCDKDVITLEIFETSGKSIFCWKKEIDAGNYSISFTPGKSMPSGLYVYKISDTKNNTHSGNIIYTK